MASLQGTIYPSGPDATLKLRIAGANDPVTGGALDHRYVINFGAASMDTGGGRFYLVQTVGVFGGRSAGVIQRVFAAIFDHVRRQQQKRVGLCGSGTAAGICLEATVPAINCLYPIIRRCQIYVEHYGFNAQNTAMRLYDVTNNRRMVLQGAGSVWNGVIPNGNGLKTCYLVSEAAVTNVTTGKAPQFMDSAIRN